MTSEWISSWVALLIRSTARSKAASLAFEGRVKPLTFRTNWIAEAFTSSSVAGGAKLWSVLMLRHIIGGFSHPALADLPVRAL